jgi:signal transduction histidine kinase
VTRSLQGRMMLALGFSITLAWVVALTTMFVYTARSEHSVGDNTLQSIAIKILLAIPVAKELNVEGPGPGLQLRDGAIPDDEQLIFQVWAGKDRLAVGTPDAPETPLRPDFVEGFTDSTISGKTWRVFSISDRSGGIYVQVGKPRSVIDRQLHTEALIALGLSTLLLALAGLLMWRAVRKSLQPVVAIENAVRGRQKFDLAPLPVAGLPIEVRPLVESFNHLMEQLDQAVQGERRFIDDAAHELRTPLSALHAQAEVALRASTMQDKDAALVKLLVVTERSARLSEQLLDLARLDAGVHAPLREWYGLDEIVVHVGSEFDVAGRKSRRAIQLTTEPCEIQCDVDEIGILLRNLVDNALRYTSDGGQIRITCGHRTTGSERKVFLEVSDDGPGVPEEEQAAIFDRFYRVAGSGTRGSGIGLSLVARIAQLHDADIETCNGIGDRGFCVRIVFPAPPDLLRSTQAGG